MIEWLSSSHNRSRLFRWSTIIGSFAVVQLLVQALNALSGFLLVRTLEKPDYAWFTIASGMSAALAILSDSGIAMAVTSIGGTVWQDKASLKGLVQAALRLRRKLATVASIVIAVISMWLLLRNGAPPSSALVLTALVVSPIWQISTTAIFNVINRLYSRTRQLQVADLAPALVRTSLTGALILLGVLTPVMALVAVLIAHLTQFIIVRTQVLPLLGTDIECHGVDAHTAGISKMVRQFMPNCIFWCLQGQLTTGLISFFATANEVADIGALNRLAIIFAVFGGPMGQYIAPAFARATNTARITSLAFTVIAVTIAFSAVLLLTAWLKGGWFLWLLGERYSHLHGELLLVLTGMAFMNLSSIVWGLNNTRSWIRRLWLNIPLTLTTQAVAVCVFDLATVKGVAGFVMATGIVQTCHALIVCCLGLSKPHIVHAG